MKWNYRGNLMTINELLINRHGEYVYDHVRKLQDNIERLDRMDFSYITPELFDDMHRILVEMYDISNDLVDEVKGFKQVMKDTAAELDPVKAERDLDEMEI